MLVPFTGQSFDDGAYGLPAARLINWYAEAAPDRPDRGFRLLPVPGVVPFHGDADGKAVTGLELQDATGHILAHTGDTLRVLDRSGALVASHALAAAAHVTRFAKSQLDVVASTGEQAFTLSDAGLAEVVLPDGASGGILDAAEAAQRHIYVEDGSARMWWSDVADAATVKADAFLTAEDDSDNLRAVRTFQGSVYLYGARSIQVLRPSGNEDAPFYPSPGGTIPKGVVGRAAVTAADFGQFFVGDDNLVYRLSGYQAERISTSWIERRVGDVAGADRPAILLTTYSWEGHTFIVLRLPGVGTWARDAATRLWHRQQSYGAADATSHRAAFLDVDGTVFVGMADGRVGTLTRDTLREMGGQTVCLAGSIVPIEDGRPVIRNAVIEAQSGQSVLEDPLRIEMRMSPDGRVWRRWIDQSVGKVGEYGHRAVVGPFGRFAPPLMALEIRYSGDVPLAINGVKLNAARP